MKNIKFVIIALICLCIAIISNCIIINYTNNEMIQTYNSKIYNFIGIIKEKYPEISDEELISVLNEKNDEIKIENGKDIAENYGIEDNDSAILKLEEMKNDTIIYSSIVMGILILIIILIWIINSIIQKRKIEGITKYIKEINNKNYELKINENAEDYLSNLRNELYKITLMLKEDAENSKKDKRFLAKSLSDISHQIKTPLTSISIMLDEIKENEKMDEETKRRFIFEISRQVEQISFLTIALLKLSKLDSGTVEFEKNKYRLDELVEEVLKNLEIPIEIKNIKVEKVLEKTYIIGDYKWTLEAINNIIKNCIEHTPDNKKIFISIRKTNIYTELIIKDEGEGIDEKDLKHIFERFYKGKNSSENSFGIGLALSKTILEKQNATISCFSIINEGTTFKIYFYEN